MNWLLTIVLSVALVELVLRLPFRFWTVTLVATTAKAARTVQGRASDHWKEKAIRAYALRSLVLTAQMLFAFVAVFGTAAVIALVGDAISPGFMAFLLSWFGILSSTVMAMGYAAWRLSGSDGAGYSATDKLLHRLALGSPSIMEMCFDIERSRLSAEEVGQARNQRHVFVAGLARSGTTVLMRKLYESGEFRSLTYRDMPFVLCPGIWRRLSAFGAQKAQKSERAHGDNIQVDFDSPEALDEPFWRMISPDYVGKSELRPHAPPTEAVERFREYVAAILKSDPTNVSKRYLSKNNNNILRLQAIRDAFPNALILIPFRSPVDHAASLLRQHKRFVAMQGEDRFTEAYMRWLAHHEFGGDHRPIVLGEAPEGDPLTMDYWLDLWTKTYSALLDIAPEGAIFVCYEALCEEEGVWTAIANRADVPAGAEGQSGFVRNAKDDVPQQKSERLERAMVIYDQLSAVSISSAATSISGSSA